MNKVQYFGKDGKELFFGDKVTSKKVTTSDWGSIALVEEYTLNEQSVDYLVGRGYIEKKECPDVKSSDYLAQQFIVNMKKTLGSYEETFKFLFNLRNLNMAAFKSLAYKNFAVILDKVYPNHISKAEEIWCIDRDLDEPFKMTGKIKSFNSFAAFRNTTDAALAILALDKVCLWMDTSDYSKNYKCACNN